MTIQEIKTQTNCVKFAIEDVKSSKLIKQKMYDQQGKEIGEKETPMDEVFKKVVIFLDDQNKQVGYCLLNEVRANALREDPSCLSNAQFDIVMNEWGDSKAPLFKVIGKLYSNVFAI